MPDQANRFPLDSWGAPGVRWSWARSAACLSMSRPGSRRGIAGNGIDDLAGNGFPMIADRGDSSGGDLPIASIRTRPPIQMES